MRINEKALIIRINRMYRENMSLDELYEMTRGVWKLSPRRSEARVAFAVYQGEVKGVYKIHSWHRAGTIQYKYRAPETYKIPGRWEFIGAIDQKWM